MIGYCTNHCDKWIIVNESNLKEYVSSVIRVEMPGAWNQEGLKA
ncbi:MAG: SpoIID/LytB domain-containing protein [Prochlorococcus sp.]